MTETDVELSEQHAGALARRDSILAAAGQAATDLIAGGDLDSEIVGLLHKMGEATGSGVTSKHRTFCLQCTGGCGGMETWPDPCE